MASDPIFAATPAVGSASVSATIETSYTTPAQSVVVFRATGARSVADGVTTSNFTVTSATAAFGAGDLFRPISGGTIPANSFIVAVGSGTSVTINNAATGSASSVTLTLGGGFGSKVEELVVEGTGITLAGVLVHSLFDGTSYSSFDSTVVTSITPSTTIAPFRLSKVYPNLFLPAGWSLVTSSWVASQLCRVTATAGNF